MQQFHYVQTAFLFFVGVTRTGAARRSRVVRVEILHYFAEKTRYFGRTGKNLRNIQRGQSQLRHKSLAVARKVARVDIQSIEHYRASFLQRQVGYEIQRYHFRSAVLNRSLGFVVGVVEQIETCGDFYVEVVMRIARDAQRYASHRAQIEETAQKTVYSKFFVLFRVHAEIKVEFEIGETRFFVSAVFPRRAEVVTGEVHLDFVAVARV